MEAKKELEKVSARIQEIEKRRSDIQKESKIKLDLVDAELKHWKAKGYDLMLNHPKK